MKNIRDYQSDFSPINSKLESIDNSDFATIYQILIRKFHTKQVTLFRNSKVTLNKMCMDYCKNAIILSIRFMRHLSKIFHWFPMLTYTRASVVNK